MIPSFSGFLRFAIHALAISLLFIVSAPALPAQNAFVRIDQLGYEAGAHNRAYLMSKTSESGAIFRVIAANGEIRCSSPVGAATTWGAFNVYALDFTVNEPGNYTIEVNGPVSTNSTAFRIDAPSKLYSGALVNALNFYRNERDGENFIKTPYVPLPVISTMNTPPSTCLHPSTATTSSSARSNPPAFPSMPQAAGGTPATI